MPDKHGLAQGIKSDGPFGAQEGDNEGKPP
jgi:hypothetical protein